jgi:hypothetical protein
MEQRTAAEMDRFLVDQAVPYSSNCKLRRLNSQCSFICITIESRQSKTNILLEIELVTIRKKVVLGMQMENKITLFISFVFSALLLPIVKVRLCIASLYLYSTEQKLSSGYTTEIAA